MPDFPYEVLRAGWAADSKSIWMIVNTGVRIDLFQVDLASPKPRQITQRRSRARAAVLEHRRGPPRVHDRRAHAHRRHLDVGAGRRISEARDGHLRLSRSRLRAAAAGAGRMEGRRRHPRRRRADLSDRLQARHALSAGGAASRRSGGLRSIRVGLDLLLLPARVGGARLRHPAAELPRQLGLRQRVLSRAGRRLLQEQPSRRRSPASIASSRWASPIPIASR